MLKLERNASGFCFVLDRLNAYGKFQRGMSLMELLIAMAISLVVSLAMISLMANTLSTGTNTIKMSRLTAGMRAAMQIMTRDLRRANFYFDATGCYADSSCPVGAGVNVIQPVGDSCFEYWYERDQGEGTEAVSGAFGKFSNVLRMNPTGLCGAGEGWVDITDPRVVNVTGFQLLDAGYIEDISKDHSQWVSKIQITMEASLLSDYRGFPATKTIQDFIYVRNNVFCPDRVCP